MEVTQSNSYSWRLAMGKRWKWTICLTVLSSILLATAGCSKPSGNPTTTQQPTTVVSSTAPKTGGTLNIALSADPTTFDPSISTAFYDRQPYQNIYDKLVDTDSSG
jgi:peptide/nickel transport system substrate-binding protein